jgi:hypothetical protein
MWTFLSTKRKVILGTVLACLLLGCTLPIIWRGIPKYQARVLCKKAHAALDQSDYQSAWIYGQKAYSLNSNSPGPNRVLGRLYAKIDPEQALYYWKRAVNISKAKEDRKILIELALDSKLLLTAFEELQALEADIPLDGDYFFLKGRYLYAQSRFDEALASTQEALRQDPKNISFVLLYAVLNLEANTHETIGSALKVLFETVDEGGSKALQALRLLAANGDSLDEDQLQKVAAGLAHQEGNTLEDRFLSLHLLHKYGLMDQETTFKQAQGLVNLKKMDEALVFLRFLNQEGWYDLTLDHLSLEESLNSKDVFLVYIDALAARNEWRKLENIFRSKANRLPIENYLRWMFEARIYKERGNEKRSQLAWDKALVEAKDQRSKLWQLAEYALLMQDADKIKLSFSRLLRENPLSLPTYIRLLEWERERGHTPKVLKLLQRMQQNFPDNLSVQNDLRYLELLMNQNLLENEAKAKLFAEQYPSVFAYRMTLALAFLKNEKEKDALSLILDLGINWKAVPTSYRALAASILAANGYALDAERMIEGLSLDGLLPEEKLLLEAYGLD